MDTQETKPEVSRRLFLQLSSAAVVSTSVGCNSPSSEAPKQPAECATPVPAAVPAPAKPLAGTAPNALRLYGAEDAFYDQTWKPDDVVKVKLAYL